MASSLPALRGAPPSSSIPVKKAQSIAPNQTLYLTNLPSKLQKSDLRLYLYTLFSTYGPVLDIVALKTMKMRGQAHVTFRDLGSAGAAMRGLQGMEFLGRELIIQYAKSKSDTIAKLDGTFNRPKVVAAGVGASTELQKSIFDGPLATVPASTAVVGGDRDVGGVPSLAGQKRRREDDEEEERGEKRVDGNADGEGQGEGEGDGDDSGSDVAMEEDSDDD